MAADIFEGINEESQAENIEGSLYHGVFTWLKTTNTFFTDTQFENGELTKQN